MEVYLIRHTTPKIAKGVCYGQSDIPLTESFLIESDKLLKLLPENFEAVYSSPSTRCYQLAKVIQPEQVICDNRLLEMHFGDWEMKKWDDIDQTMLNDWMKNFVEMRVPNGENFIDLNNRVNDFINDLLKQKYKKAAIVTHGGVILCFLARISKIPLKDAFSISVDYASINKITLI